MATSASAASVPSEGIVSSSAPSSNPSAAPSASISPTGPTTFAHKPSTAAPVKAFLDLHIPAINTVPLELDSTPVSSPVARQAATWKDQLPAIAAVNSNRAAGKEAGDGDKTRLRAEDPAVMVAPPGTPGAEDFQAAETDVKAQTCPD